MAETSTDPVAAYLAEVRERSESPVAHVTSLPISHDGVRGLVYSAGDVPRLLAAVEAVLAAHESDDEASPFCRECGFGWPCSTIRAISAALLAEGDTDAH